MGAGEVEGEEGGASAGQLGWCCSDSRRGSGTGVDNFVNGGAGSCGGGGGHCRGAAARGDRAGGGRERGGAYQRGGQLREKEDKEEESKDW